MAVTLLDFLNDFDEDFVRSNQADSICTNLIKSIDNYCVRKSKVAIRLDLDKMQKSDSTEIWRLLSWTLQFRDTFK